MATSAVMPCPECRRIADDPAMDVTDLAHPAWWRGYEHGAATATQLLAKRLGIAYTRDLTWQSVLARVKPESTLNLFPTKIPQ